jgi:hypothetical protein
MSSAAKKAAAKKVAAADARPSRRKDAAPRLDAANLAGITMLMNPQHVKPGLNLDEAEKNIMGKGGTVAHKSEIDPVRMYTDELNQLATELGINLLEGGNKTAPSAPSMAKTGGARPATAAQSVGLGRPVSAAAVLRPRSTISTDHIGKLIDDLDLGDKPSTSRARPESRSKSKRSRKEVSASSSEEEESDESGEYESGEYETDSGSGEYETDSGSGEYETDSGEYETDSDEDSDDSDDSDDDSDDSDESSGEAHNDKVDDIISRLESDLGIKADSKQERRRRRVRETEVPIVERRHRGGERITEEQEHRNHINSVVSDISGETRTTFGVERERIQDIKASKLEQIGQLRQALEEENIDCKAVKMPSPESPMEEIDSVLNILRLKNDRNRYSSMAEEVILGAAEGIETVFDGTRAVPLLGWRPDYTGYHNTVNVKLHRMRFETSQVVGKIIEKYNIGPTARIIMELLPSFFLYPRQQKKQRGTPGLSSDPRVADARGAISAIRSASEQKSLDDLRNL